MPPCDEKEPKMIRATLRAAARAALVLGLAGGLCSLPAQAQQGEAAMMKRVADLRDSPAESGRSLAALPAQEPVTRLGDRQGAWIRVQTRAGVAGWVHMFDFGPRTATFTIGIRGLEAEDLARAQPNLHAVARMEQLRQGENEARQFAAEAALAAATVPALPSPSRGSSPGGNSNPQQQ